MSDPAPPFTAEQLASDDVGKKELATKIQEIASHSFLVEHKLKGAVKNVVKTKSKDQLVADYNELFSTKAFKKEGEEEVEKKVEKVVEETKKLTVKEKVKEVPKYRKVVMKKGTNSNLCQKGDTAAVLYTGKLSDGTVFDSNTLNVKRGKKPIPIRFKVGKGQVIRGWDECIQTMSMGEKAELVIEPEWAYGKKGLEGKIPPNSTLHFDIELWAIE